MGPQQKRSFLPYSRGINPGDLRLGSLFLNPLDPDDGLESKRFEYQPSLKQEEYDEHVAPWLRDEQLDERGFRLEFQITSNTSLALQFSDLLKAEGSGHSTTTATLIGASGRRLKIKSPEKFLKEEVIKQPGAQEWIRNQASILFSGWFGNNFKAPEIWMVTGVQLVTRGNVHVGSSKSISGTLGASGDPGAALGIPPGLTKVGSEARHGHGSEANSGYGYSGERVWAAQFMKVKIEYGTKEDKTLKSLTHKAVPATILSLELEDIADLGARGIRGTEKEREDANGQMFVKPPKPIGRIVVDEEEDDSDSDGIKLGDEEYVNSLSGTNWEMHDEALKYLRDAEIAQTRSTQISPELVKD